MFIDVITIVLYACLIVLGIFVLGIVVYIVTKAVTLGHGEAKLFINKKFKENNDAER